ncbi:hypothetical protein PHAVU_008G241200 [Phaseolus vulgaris]|uniref:NAC domain-containing protein n=1 Tax=Phaseolus vulgaris TaxID=3885 RepID=V7B7U7_PHAVU|nr:hypothetical protein PHAVU_008G241200g [Phaseolus vulgaris]ESW13962.1 hypothetical protein PHAVU_008G241200g [Phaseolus vulgaris]
MAPVLPPGFRFHPTDEELVAYYLKRKINGRKIELEIIPEVDLYKCEPWDLPGKSLLPGKDLEWYFFSPRDRKYPNGSRTNRATKSGYWKATGKDRKVNSKARSVGMKKTLVYYRGRAPHGSRTNWVMHEYRLDERECETASGLQDAYALCRVLKKTAVIPQKVEGHYVEVPNVNQITSDQSSSIELYSEGRGEDLDSSNYFMSVNTCSPHNLGIETPLNISGGTTRDHEKWSHVSLQDPMFSLPTSYPHFGAYLPSKVDIALECARMQHRFVMPPLEVDDFPQVGISELKMTQASSSMQGSRPETDILQEILSVAHASQELINQSSYSQEWGGNDYYYAPRDDDFTFMVGTNYNHSNEMSSARYVDKAWEDANTRTIEIGDMDQEFKAERMVENLRWVGMSREDLEKMEEQNIVPIEDISSLQTNMKENEVQEYEQHNMEHNDTEINDFSLGFINDSDPTENFTEDGNSDDYSGSPSFEVVEEIKVNRGMFVSTGQVAETFFHQMVPSQTVQVQLNTVMAHDHYVENAEAMLLIMEDQGSLRKVKAYVMGKLLKPSMTIASAVVFVFALVLMHYAFIKGEVKIWNETCCSNSGSIMKKTSQSSQIMKWNEPNEVWFVGIKSEKGLSAVLKKIGIFLTISFALCTMWANHN